MILLIDTTTNPTTIGLWDGEKLKTKTIESNTENNRKLVSIIETFGNSLKIGNWKLKIDSVGVINGPGTFTGVRTGVTIANTIAYALKIPIYSIGTLSAHVGVGLAPAQIKGQPQGLPLRQINNVVSLLSASNTEAYFARFEKGEMQGKIEIVDVTNNLPNRIKKGDLIIGDLQEKHCGIWGSNEFRNISSKERVETLLQMIINKRLKPQKQALPLYIKKPNISTPKKK